MRVITALLCSTLLVSGTALADSSNTPPIPKLGADEGVIIVALPGNSSVTFKSGTVADGRFDPDGWSGDKFELTPKDGGEHELVLMAFKVKATPKGRGYAMSHISMGVGIDTFCGQKVPVISVKPGQLQYYGAYVFVFQRRIVDDKEKPMMSITQKYDLNAAKAFAHTNYPDLGEVTEGELLPARFGNNC